MKIMKKYFDYLKSSMFGKMTLCLLCIMIVLVGYCLITASVYLSALSTTLICIISIMTIMLVWLCHYKRPRIAFVIEIIIIICLAVMTIALNKIHTFTKDITQTQEVETVQIVALKDSSITKDQSFDSLTMAYVQDDELAYTYSSEILKENQKKVKKEKPYKDMKNAYDDLQNHKIDLLVLTNISKSDLFSIDENYTSHIKVIMSKDYPLQDFSLKSVDISTTPFTIYFQGADLSSGDNINSTGRGDVNILLTVNPKTKKVNMQVIPRDLFVYIPCKDASSKLSYSGWWGGIQSSIASIEKALDIQINYYAKINFDGLTDLVDALGGVEVYSHYTYDAGGYHFQKGYNHVDGKEALMFARARKMLPLNERSRGYQQMELIKAIFTKFAKEPTYDHAMSVMNTLQNNFTTNLPEKDFMKAYQLVVDLLPQLQTMENHSIEGEYKWHYDEVRPTYYQYYFYPDKGQLEQVKERIDQTIAG